MQKLKIDKEFQKLIPPQQEAEHKQLEENILAEGCRDPLVIWNGTIIDGHNRYKICIEHNITFKVVEMEFSDRDEAKIWIIKNQFGRRNLIPFQRGELALVLKPLISAKAKQKQISTQNNNAGKAVSQKSDELGTSFRTDEEIAKHAGVSRDTIRKVETIKKSGTPEQIERARTGGKGNTVNAIYSEIVQRGETERKCSRCGNVLPIDRFYGDKTVCKSCTSTARHAGGVGRGAGKRELLETIMAVSDTARDLNREIQYTIDDLVEELSCLNTDFLQKLRRAIGAHDEILQSKTEKQKIIAVLSEAETAIRKVSDLFK